MIVLFLPLETVLDLWLWNSRHPFKKSKSTPDLEHRNNEKIYLCHDRWSKTVTINKYKEIVINLTYCWLITGADLALEPFGKIKKHLQVKSNIHIKLKKKIQEPTFRIIIRGYDTSALDRFNLPKTYLKSISVFYNRSNDIFE